MSDVGTLQVVKGNKALLVDRLDVNKVVKRIVNISIIF